MAKIVKPITFGRDKNSRDRINNNSVIKNSEERINVNQVDKNSDSGINMDNCPLNNLFQLEERLSYPNLSHLRQVHFQFFRQLSEILSTMVDNFL